METIEWIILDTETTGFSAPIFVVKIAAFLKMVREADLNV